jgi:hypothetical protein
VMDSPQAMPGFLPASEIPRRNLSRELELEEKIRQSEAENERLRELASSETPRARPEPMKSTELTIKPQDWQALLEVISDLQTANGALQATIKRQTLQIEDLQKANKNLGQEVYDVHEMARTIIQTIAKRVTAIEEERKPKKTDNNVARLNDLAQALLVRAKAGQKGVTYSEAAKILKLDKSRICQLRSLIASDSRFDISWHPNRKNTKIICLKNYKIKEIV